MQHQMTMNGKSDEFTREDIVALGKQFDIKRPSEVLDNVVSVFSGWGAMAKEYGVTKEQVTEITKKHRYL